MADDPSPRVQRLSRRLGGAATRRRRHRRVALGAVALLVVAGVLFVVGGRDESFEDRASSICEDNDEAVAEAQQLLAPAERSDDSDAGFLAGAFADLQRERIAELRELEPPEEQAAAWSEALEAHEGVIAAIEDDPQTALEAGRAGVDPFTSVEVLFDDVGVPACGTGG